MEQYHETILVVEDDVQIRNFICYALKAEGFRCVTAGNAATAMKQLLAEPVDMMLLDLGLPDMDGGEVLKKVREWSEMPIIIVSARDQDREKAAMLDLGADDYLTKPFSATELMAVFRVALRHLYPSGASPAAVRLPGRRSGTGCGEARSLSGRRTAAPDPHGIQPDDPADEKCGQGAHQRLSPQRSLGSILRFRHPGPSCAYGRPQAQD